LYSQMLLSKVESTERILVCLINFLKSIDYSEIP